MYVYPRPGPTRAGDVPSAAAITTRPLVPSWAVNTSFVPSAEMA